MPAENFYLKHDPLQVLDYPVPLQRLLGFHLPGAVLNKFYSGPGEHDVLLASSNLRGRRIDWASIGQPAPPTPDGVTYLPLMEPAEGSVVTPRVLPPSIAAATASLEGLYAEYNSEAGGHCRTKLHAALSAATPAPVTVTWDVNSPLVDTVGELLAAVDRDGVAILSGAVSHAGENQRSLFLNLARLNTDDLPGRLGTCVKKTQRRGRLPQLATRSSASFGATRTRLGQTLRIKSARSAACSVAARRLPLKWPAILLFLGLSRLSSVRIATLFQPVFLRLFRACLGKS
jgi:hypothetical protein